MIYIVILAVIATGCIMCISYLVGKIDSLNDEVERLRDQIKQYNKQYWKEE